MTKSASSMPPKPANQRAGQRRRQAAPLLAIGLEPDAALPLHRQVYFAIREAILSTRLRPGSRLPSSRALARDLSVSRNTVMAAFEQLHAEGYIEGQVGAGSFVSEELPEVSLHARIEAAKSVDTKASPGPSARGRQLAEIPSVGRFSEAFSPGLPELATFPFEDWARLLARYWRRPPKSFLIGSDAAGWRPLREALTHYLGSARAVICEPDQIFIVSGAQQAIDLTVRALVDPGDTVWVEDPGYAGLHGALEAGGAKIVGVPVDDQGLSVADGGQLSPKARMACVSPSHQFPLGVTMSLARRIELLEWARTADAFILEDDYDSEYRYSGRPLAALQGLDSDGRVIYVGTMSKVMFPGLRLGYMVVPKHLVKTFRAIRSLTDAHPTTIAQPALAEFIADGHLAAHIRRMRALYATRQAEFLKHFNALAVPNLRLQANDAGMHLVARLPASANDHFVANQALQRDVVVPALSTFYRGQAKQQGLLFGYAGVSEPVMARSLAKIAPLLASACGSS